MKPSASPLPKKQRVNSSLVMSRKGKEVPHLEFDRMGCRTEVAVAYQWNLSIMWVEKGPNKDEGGEGDVGREDGSDDEDEESGEVNPVPILDNDSEVREVVKDLMKQGYGHCDSIEGRETVTLPVERVERVNVESTQNETKLFPTCTVGAFSSQQLSNLLRSFLDELKATVENMLDRIENFLISLDGRVQQINGAIFKTGVDVGAVMQMVHNNMSTLLKKAAELRKKT
ncbi:hypothetical protein Scep_023910 [Stephania cephalantha]|uniref:Uncharacterized protein n=1 Tax=Stephania cephalantha TaxID=152367 RepID=A0AAP0EVJ2_9MAGN